MDSEQKTKEMKPNERKDRSAAAGLGTTAGTTVAEGAAVVALTGGSASASADRKSVV